MEWCKDDVLTLIEMFNNLENLWNCTSNEYKNKRHDVFDFFGRNFHHPLTNHNGEFVGTAIVMGGN